MRFIITIVILVCCVTAEAQRHSRRQPSPNSGIIYKGVRYKTYAEFKKTDVRQQMLVDAISRREFKKARSRASLRVLQNRMLYNQSNIFLKEDERNRMLVANGRRRLYKRRKMYRSTIRD